MIRRCGRVFFSAAFMGALAMTTSTAGAQPAPSTDPEDSFLMELETGTVTIATYPDVAPQHVARIRELARDGYYDGIVFHRVIQGFMAQGGDPTGTGRGGSGQNIPGEFTEELSFGRGTVGMARTPDPDSADSQFFICFQDCSFLDGQYTIWGQVTEGMEAVDALPMGEPPADPGAIVRMRVAADEG